MPIILSVVHFHSERESKGAAVSPEGVGDPRQGTSLWLAAHRGLKPRVEYSKNSPGLCSASFAKRRRARCLAVLIEASELSPGLRRCQGAERGGDGRALRFFHRTQKAVQQSAIIRVLAGGRSLRCNTVAPMSFLRLLESSGVVSPAAPIPPFLLLAFLFIPRLTEAAVRQTAVSRETRDSQRLRPGSGIAPRYSGCPSKDSDRGRRPGGRTIDDSCP